MPLRCARCAKATRQWRKQIDAGTIIHPTEVSPSSFCHNCRWRAIGIAVGMSGAEVRKAVRTGLLRVDPVVGHGMHDLPPISVTVEHAGCRVIITVDVIRSVETCKC